MFLGSLCCLSADLGVCCPLLILSYALLFLSEIALHFLWWVLLTTLGFLPKRGPPGPEGSSFSLAEPSSGALFGREDN